MVLMNRSRSVTLGLFCLLAGSATAAELNPSETKDLISGKTHYTDLASLGTGVTYYGANGSVLYKPAKGPVWHGTWTLKDNTICIAWKEDPGKPCVKFEKQGEAINVADAATGTVYGKLVKSAAGNAENLQ
jgi:hypothetical protein